MMTIKYRITSVARGCLESCSTLAQTPTPQVEFGKA